MSVHYVRDCPQKPHLSEPPAHNPIDPHRREIKLTQETFDALGDYTRSLPTGPSEGRIYKKNFGWPAHVDDNWFVYIVIKATDGCGMMHVPYTPVIV